MEKPAGFGAFAMTVSPAANPTIQMPAAERLLHPSRVCPQLMKLAMRSKAMLDRRCLTSLSMSTHIAAHVEDPETPTLNRERARQGRRSSEMVGARPLRVGTTRRVHAHRHAERGVLHLS